MGKNYPEYEDRAFFIVRKLIETEEWITYEQVAAELHFSHQTIRSDVQKIAHLIARRNIDLKLETVIFHGIRLTGSEWSKRMLWHEMARLQCTSSEEGKFLIHKYFDSNDSMPGLYEDVQHLIRKENALATPEQVTSTVAHLFILCKRDGEKCKLELVIPLESKEYVLAKKLLEKTGEVANHIFSDDAVLYLSAQLIGFKWFFEPEKWRQTEASFYLPIIQQSLRNSGAQFHYPLAEDEELVQALSAHLMKTAIALQRQIPIRNPLLDQIKSDYIQAYQMAVLVADEWKKKLKWWIPEQETGYIALHLAHAMERLKSKKMKVAILNTGNSVTANLIKYRVLRRIPEIDIQGIYTTDTIEYCPEDVQLILSTFPYESKRRKVIVIHDLLTREDLEIINRSVNIGIMKNALHPDWFFRGNEKTKEQFLNAMLKAIGKEHYLSSLLEREALSSTEVGHKSAIPHPLVKMKEKKFSIHIGINEKPILWGNKYVQLVFLFFPTDTDREYYERLFREVYQLVTSEARVEQLIWAKTFDEFIQQLY
ncbi:BglG family transcription antiterminator [Paenibacillus larvae]|uniref:BglG family transcription antiterminator n=1 Tax=Paenibacillus larvae TaxID=1464 RepID=UPI001EE0DFBB|nr:PRD domain-containing protein [Paenibacillus larvae]MCY9499088.1 PRD domain-containing protein [Paenibacillus larvae]MCY9747109.1 PRD domain-containing protein [Paenibacillus larvae]MEC0088222.1 PRD domain-containing protein [Paenibacillus larvae]